MSKAERHLALRESLITIGQSTIAAHGLGGLKARDIAHAAGCALGAIYLVFPDLDALILAVNDRTLAAIDAAICASLDCETAAASSADPGRQLVLLSCAYLDYALAHPRLWAALFNHTLPPGQSVPDDYRAHQAHLFSYVEAPLAALCPNLDVAARTQAARTLFSAVHGIVSLGLDQKLSPIPVEELRNQLAAFVQLTATGLRHACFPPVAP